MGTPNKKTDEVVVKVPQGVRTIKIEFDAKDARESRKPSRRKICD